MDLAAIIANLTWVHYCYFGLIAAGVILVIIEFLRPSYGLAGYFGATIAVIALIQLHEIGFIKDLHFKVPTLSSMVGLGFVFTFVAAKKTYKIYHKKNTVVINSMIGNMAHVINWHGKKGRILIKGEDWLGYSDEPLKLKVNNKITILGIEGQRIKITPLKIETNKEKE